jgi:hypothetical protein
LYIEEFSFVIAMSRVLPRFQYDGCPLTQPASRRRGAILAPDDERARIFADPQFRLLEERVFAQFAEALGGAQGA